LRFARKLRLLFFLSLTLGLFGGELGESFRLADDVSNDYVQMSASPLHKCVEIASQDLSSQGSVALAQELLLSLRIHSSSHPSFYPVSDLLRLISVQRK
jgi:hypothetical protein